MSKRITIHLCGTRSHASITKSVIEANTNLYGNNYSSESDYIEIKEVYDKDGSLTNFELTGAALDLFHVGLRYGTLEERKRQEQLNC